MSTPSQQHPTRGEEIANALSHGIALLIILIATPFLLIEAASTGGARFIVGASVFSATMIMLYLASTLYHAMPPGASKNLFRLLDYSAIYLLIAGTYTPFTIGVVGGAWGWTLFGIVWGLAALGILLKIIFGVTRPILRVSLYLAMGWMVLIALEPFTAALPSVSLMWLLAGGIAYTVGVIFFSLDHRLRYSHFVWHLFVAAGTTCHFIAVMQSGAAISG
ncbi:hemolysin D [Halorhodospira abdelmalekii]|uniref:PAQR family membrane homeostasis protein TrhA n=1 Tax=Halorhodospira abdelmalekii TaxID=421629 RepID=UPI001903FF68|nr:hemolysin D [Halorhodospira abdelmalekii]